MDFTFFKGCAIGLSIAAPVGPIGVLCIRRSLADGARVGFVTGLGAAAADGCYGAVAAFGLVAISEFMLSQQVWIRLLGGLFLLYLGIKTFRARPAVAPPSISSKVGAFASTFVLTLTNPMTIFSFMAIFAGFGLAQTAEAVSPVMLTLGVFVGSAAWWLFLSYAVALLRSRITTNWMQQVNRVSGLVILAFAVAILAKSRVW